MSQSSDLVVIDIGSKSICAYVAEPLSADNFALKSSCEIEYDGYSEGEWINQSEVLSSVLKLLDKLERSSGKIKAVYVGIPADFCVVKTVYDKVSFPKPKRILSTDIKELFDLNDPFSSTELKRLRVDPIYYIDDRGERLLDPIGRTTSFLKARLSYIGTSEDLLTFFTQGLMRHGVKTVRFVQSEYAAALSLFSKEEREQGILMVDIGYHVTSVLHLSGDALIEMRTFALGGSMIPLGLSGKLDIPFRVASALTSKINFGYKDEGEYSLKYDTAAYCYSIGEINGVAKECILCLANYVQKALRSLRFESVPHATVYLTGGGISEIRLAREYFAKCLDRKVEQIAPTTPNFAKPYYSTAVGLIRAAMEREKKGRFGFLKKLFNIGG